MKVLIGHIGRLPNISGEFGRVLIRDNGLAFQTGVFAGSSITDTAHWQPSGDWGCTGKFNFFASNSSSIYQNNALPESKSLSLKYWLRNA